MRTRRREFITLLAGAAASWPRTAMAQQSGIPTVGFLGTGSSSGWHPWIASFVQRLNELGWIDGRTITIEYRWGEGLRERFAEIAVDGLIAANRTRILTFATSARLPTIVNAREHAEAGALMSYGPNFHHLFRRAAEYVDRILRGANPAELPVEQPTKFDLVINP